MLPTPPVAAAAPTTVTPWRTVLVSVGFLALQALLLDRLVGEELLSIPAAFVGRRFLRKEVLLVVLAAAAVLQAHVRRHLAAYRLAPLALPRLALQGLAFGALFGYLLALSAGLPQAFVGDLAARAVAAVLVLVWVASLALLLPAGTDVGAVAAGAAFAATVVAVGVAITDTVTETFWKVTGGTTVRMVEWLITPFAGGPVVRPKPFDIGAQDFIVTIHGGCSGYQGITLITVLFTGYLWWFRRLHRFPQSLLLFPLGIGLIFLSNAVRIAALILVGIWIDPQIAIDGFHSQAGWIMFLIVGLGLIWTTSRIPFFTVAPEGAPEGVAGAVPAQAASAPLHGPSATACLFPFLALMATSILTGAFSTHGGLDILYPFKVVMVAAVLWSLRHEFRWREARLSPVAVGVGVATFAMWFLLAPSINQPDMAAAARKDPAQLGMLWGSVWLLFRLVGYTITVPIAEELAFRGFLARRLVGDDVERVPLGTFTWLSFIVSSLAFGGLHQGDWFPGTLAGMAFALALYHRRQLVDAIVAHAVTNALVAAYVIGTGAWAAFG